MVNPALQSAIEAMSLDERLELVEFIEKTVESAPIDAMFPDALVCPGLSCLRRRRSLGRRAARAR